MILVNNPGSWNHIYAPLDHAKWHGCTPTDLVFPFFLFAVGNALSFVMPRLQEAGAGDFWKKVLRRSASIFLIGLFLNWLPFFSFNADGELVFRTWSHVRILGVLQRIAICYLFASIIIYYLKERGAFLAALILLLIYWAVCIAFGDHLDPYSFNGWFGTRIDKAILGENHMYHGEGVAFDPEGLMSTIPAIVQVIFGYMVGNYIIKKGKSYEMVSNLFVAGTILVFTGYCWDMIFPINKKIWTSSYVVYTSGLATIILAVLIHVIEFWNRRGWWSRFFDVFGKNPLFIFALSAVVVKTYGLFRIQGLNSKGQVVYNGLGAWMYDHLFAPVFGAMNGSLFYAIFHIIIFWLLARLLDRKKIYIKV